MGCGTGVHLAHYLELGASKVVGLDLSELMLKQAESDLAKIGKNRPLLTALLANGKLDKIPEIILMWSPVHLRFTILRILPIYLQKFLQK
ncbi:SAM-dependent methyltransferase [Actinobacillus pleuropneumoniae]|nr:SAM-dependent methyltransferase [Actinobacillus pleuropneumoniae]